MSLRRGASATLVLLALFGCSSESGDSPPYASCSDALPAPVYADATEGAPNQIELHAGTFYWAANVVVDGEPRSGIVAFVPGGGDPKLVVSLDYGVGKFWIDDAGFLMVGGDDALWRAPLDGSSAPQKLFTLTDHPAAWAKDATTLYGVSDKLLTTTTTTDLTSRIDVVAQPLDGTPSRAFASWTVPSGGLGELLYDDGDSIVGAVAGSIFRLAKSDGHVVAQEPLVAHNISFVYGTPPRGDVFLVGIGGDPRIGSLALDGTLTNLWPSDLPALSVYEAGVRSDGTIYVSGSAQSAQGEVSPAVARVPVGGRPSILQCTHDTGSSVRKVLVADDALFVVRVNSFATTGWTLDRISG